MKLHEIITEVHVGKRKHVSMNVDERVIRQFAETVKERCSPYLKSKSVDVNLYRGRTSPEQFDVLTPKERRPYSDKERTKELHDLMINDGFTATRLNSFFAVGDASIADEYGYPHLLFPAGNFQLTWNTSDTTLGHADLGIGDWLALGIRELRYKREEMSSEELHKEAVKKFWEKYGGDFKHGQDVEAAVRTNNEILVWGQQIYTVHNDVFEQNEYLFKQILYGANND